MKTPLVRINKKLSSNIVIIDGFSASGKSLVCPILSYLERSENWQIDYNYEHLAIINYLKNASKNAVKNILETRSDELIYNLYIGRNINLRAKDQTSPIFINLEKKYVQRSKKDENSVTVDEIRNNNPIIPIHVHYIYGYSKILFDSLKDRLGLYIVMLRDPFFLIQNWHEENWVNKIGKNPRDFHLCIKFNDNLIPWYTKEYAREYVKANDLEKSILTIYNLYKRIFNMFNSSKQKEKERILLIFFNEFIKFPDNYIDKICDTLKSKRNLKFDYIMNMLNLPRKNREPVTTFEKFLKIHSNNISPKYKKIIKELNKSYIHFYNSNNLV